MARYISLIKFTETGAREIQDSSKRAKKFEQAAAREGVKVEGKFWAVGAYDGVLILSASKSEKILRCLSQLVAQGYVTTQSMEIFNEKEFKALVK